MSSPDSDPVAVKNANRFLHFYVQDQYASTLLSLPDQGKVARALTLDTFANGSTWQYNGLNFRFKDWRFIHRARLNCIPLNSVKSRWSNASPKCRQCPSTETLPHVLCHCKPNMVNITRRHTKILDRISNAIRFGTVSIDQTVEGSNSLLRPDIVIVDNNNVIIIDVCCPFDNDVDALRMAEERKITKYAGLKQFFVDQGKKCEVFGFVIGALGTWYPSNENILRHIGMAKSYRSLFRKLCCSDVIQGSTDVYRDHLGLSDDGDTVPTGDPPTAASSADVISGNVAPDDRVLGGATPLDETPYISSVGDPCTSASSSDASSVSIEDRPSTTVPAYDADSVASVAFSPDT